MVDNSNKMPPDPQFEKLGLKGWRCFRETLLAIKKHYNLYGDIVLEKQLGESIDIYKDAFKSANFEDAIRKIWEERYHYIAGTLAELISLYEKAFEEGIEWDYLLPESTSYKDGETRGNDKTFSLSKKLYVDIVSIAYENDKKFIVVKDNNAYELSFTDNPRNSSDTFNKINMKKINVIAVE